MRNIAEAGARAARAEERAQRRQAYQARWDDFLRYIPEEYHRWYPKKGNPERYIKQHWRRTYNDEYQGMVKYVFDHPFDGCERVVFDYYRPTVLRLRGGINPARYIRTHWNTMDPDTQKRMIEYMRKYNIDGSEELVVGV